MSQKTYITLHYNSHSASANIQDKIVQYYRVNNDEEVFISNQHYAVLVVAVIIIIITNKKAWFVCGWQVKLCDPVVTHGPYLSTFEIRSLYIKGAYI